MFINVSRPVNILVALLTMLSNCDLFNNTVALFLILSDNSVTLVWILLSI